jgi:anti-sigma B factor antagonist
MSSLVLHQRQVGDVLVIAPEGRIAFGYGDQELGEAVRGALAGSARKIVINFEKVAYIDSSGIGELVSCYAAVKNRQGELRICSLNSKVTNLIKMTSLFSVFSVHDTEEDALNGF